MVKISLVKFAIITVAIAFVVSVVIAVNMKEKSNSTDKNIEGIEYVSGSEGAT